MLDSEGAEPPQPLQVASGWPTSAQSATYLAPWPGGRTLVEI